MIITRQCSTCIYFRRAASSLCDREARRPASGRCVHPWRQIPIGPQPWVRDRELPCRVKWDADLWEEGAEEDDRLLDIRIADPPPPDSGDGQAPRNLLQRLIIQRDLPLIPDPREEMIGAEIDGLDADCPMEIDEHSPDSTHGRPQ